MESKPPEDGFEELLRLSRETSKVEQNLSRKEQDRVQKTQVVHGLREIKVSVALEQLKLFASPEIIEAVNSQKNKRSTGDLRNLILDLASELETIFSGGAGSNPDMVSTGRNVKTLVILIELLFSLE